LFEELIIRLELKHHVLEFFLLNQSLLVILIKKSNIWEISKHELHYAKSCENPNPSRAVPRRVVVAMNISVINMDEDPIDSREEKVPHMHI